MSRSKDKKEKCLVVGKSGSGKDFLMRNLVKKDLIGCLKTTTRPKRKHETQGITYDFVSDLSFKQMIQNEELLCYQTFNVTPVGRDPETWYYGITKKEFERAQVFVMTPGEFTCIDPETRKNCFVVYLDIDTIISPKYFNLSISNIIDSIDKIENKIGDIYIGNDPSPSEAGNAGIIIIRNTKWSKQFLNLWWSKYNPNNWKIVNNKWICKNKDVLCNWAGDDYEQGEFNKIYRHNDINSKDHIIILHYSILSNNNSCC